MKYLSILICSVFSLLIGSYVYAQSHLVKIIELDNIEEYVLIKNSGKTAVNLEGWELHDHDYGKTKVFSYTFLELELQPDQVLQMQSGKTKKEQKETAEPGRLENVHHYILWANRKVWNNGCDIAYLLDNTGKLIDEKQEGDELKTSKKESCK